MINSRAIVLHLLKIDSAMNHSNKNLKSNLKNYVYSEFYRVYFNVAIFLEKKLI